MVASTRWPAVAAGVIAAALAATPYLHQNQHNSSLSQFSRRSYWPTDGWQHATPASQGMHATLLAEAVKFVRLFNMGGGRRVPNRTDGAVRWAIDRHADAMLVIKGGYLVAEHYWGTTTNSTLHDIESGGKSVASIIAAHAVGAGHFALDTAINGKGFYPQLRPLNPSAAAARLTVETALNMAGGCNVTPWQARSPPGEPRCWVWNEQFRRGPPGQPGFVAEHGILERPGSAFVYSFANTGLMSGVMSAATGLSYAAYGAKHVFPKLGITREQWRWFGDREGHSEGDGDSYHTAPNYAKLAYLVLNKGVWDGEQLLDPTYIAGPGGPGRPPRPNMSDCDFYSRFFWRKPLAGVPRDAFYAWGGGGQFAVMVPSLDLVVVTLYGGIKSHWVPPPDIATYKGSEFFPLPTDVISKTRDGDGLCTGATGWNFSVIQPTVPAFVTPSSPASEVPGGTGCSNGATRGDLLTGMMARVVAAVTA